MATALTKEIVLSSVEARPRFAWIEPLLFIAGLAGVIWLLSPNAPHISPVIIGLCLIMFPVVSVIVRRDHPRELGLRFDNVICSGQSVAIITLLLTAMILAIGFVLGWPLKMPSDSMTAILKYSPWGLAQQFVLQAFVYRRLRLSFANAHRTALVSALLFSLVHLPNPLLVVTTAIAGYCWCRLFERVPNLFTLALSHAWLATLLMSQVPSSIHHAMRVGPRFWMP